MRFYILLLFSSLCIPDAFSQQYVFKVLSYKEGLNTYNIIKTVEDRFGFIWVATQDGLYRFDGKNFDVIKRTTEQVQTICGNHIFDVCYDGHNLLYLACYEGGIDAVNIETLQINHLLCKEKGNFNLLQNGFVRKILLDSLEHLWICGEDFTARYHLPTATIDYPLKAYYKPGGAGVNCIAAISKLSVIAGFDQLGLVYIDAATGNILKVVSGSHLGISHTSFQFKAIFLRGTSLTVVTDYGITEGQVRKGNVILLRTTKLPDADAGTISCAAADSNGNIWLAASGNLIKYNEKERTFIKIFYTNTENKVTTQTIHHLLTDRQNNLWASTSKQLLFCSLTDNGIRAFRGSDSVPVPHLYTLLGIDSNHIYATGTDGLYLVNLQNGMVKQIRNSNKLGTVHHIQRLRDKDFLISTDKGMYLYDAAAEQLSKEALLVRHPEWAPYQYYYFNSALQHGNKQYWASEEEEGLLIWDEQKNVIVKAKAYTFLNRGLKENLLHNIKQDKEGYAWLLSNNTLSCFDMNKDTVVKTYAYSKYGNGLKATIFFDMYDDGENLWFGSYGAGICILNKHSQQWRYITEKNGLCNNAVYSLLPEKNAYVWAATNNGLSRVRIADGKCTNYYMHDGLQSNAFDEKGGLAWNDCLYFAGIDGFSEINLSKFRTHALQKELFVKRVEYYQGNEKNVLNTLDQTSMTMPAGTNIVNVHVCIPDFQNEERYSVFYQIENEVHTPYLPVNSNYIIQLNGLSHGKYVFKIKYTNAAGLNEWAYKSFTITIQPHWYETIWLKIALTLALAAVFYSFYRYRLSQLKARETIRLKIASDLHDDLGSTLTSIRIFTDLALLQNSKTFLLQIKQGVQDAMTATRDMIWMMDNTRNSAARLAEKISQFALPLTGAKEVHFEMQADQTLDHLMLQPDEQRNLYLISKEFITNSLKYAQCRKIMIGFKKEGKKVSLILADDGTGFDIHTIQQGNGISNILSRAAAINYRAAFHSVSGSGTTLQLLPKKKGSILRGY